MTITLEPETEARLREKAEETGEDIHSLVRAAIQAYLDDIDAPPPGILSLRDDDVEGLKAAVAEGEADFAAGRFSSLEEFKADMHRRYGLPM